MNKRLIATSTLASALAIALAPAHAADAKAPQEKCYGVAKADNDANDWKYVAKGSCEKMGGSTTAGAKK